MDIFTPMEMLQALETVGRPKTFLKDTFFPGEKTFVTEDVLFDIKKGKRRLAPIVAPRVGGITIEREGFETHKVEPLRVAPQRPLTIDDVIKRGFGEQINSRKTPAQRQAELTAADLQELNDTISRREEWLSAETLFKGKAILKGRVSDSDTNVIEREIDFGFTNKVVLSGTSLWDKDTADILANLRAWRLQVLQSTGVAPDTVILGEDAVTAFLGNKKLQDLMNIRNMSVMTVEPSLRDDAITFLGKIPGLGLEVYSYDEWYLDDDNVEKPFVPKDVALLAKAGGGSFGYGAITQMDKREDPSYTTTEGRAVPKKWADMENDIIMLRLTSRPVPMPADVNGWLVAKVVE